MTLRICVCGGRDYTHEKRVWALLDAVLAAAPQHQIILISGGAKGADSHAKIWAVERGVKNEIYMADWRRHGRAAGPIRNKNMLSTGIDLLIAMPGGPGTQHMINICRENKVRVYQDSWTPHVIMSAPENTELNHSKTTIEQGNEFETE